MKTRFEWDAVKAASKQRKHRVSFELAVRVFADPHALTGPDRIENGELRWQTVGWADGCLLLLVAHTVRDAEGCEVIRIVSARRADGKERRRYEQNRYA